MTKPLLCAAFLAVAAMPAMAEKFNVEYPDFSIQRFSPDGKYAISAIEGTVLLLNLDTEEHEAFEGDGISIGYNCGIGNCMANGGIFVGTTTGNDAAYYNGSEWVQLKVPHPELVNGAHGITPDGSVICGGIGTAAVSVDTDAIMSVPCIWTRGEDGTYGDPVVLPHPTKDFTGRVPQYVTARYISDDGTVVAGQVRDFSGFIQEPVVYTKGTDGEWSYTMIHPELFNPGSYVFPEFPGDGPITPTLESFMTEEEIAAYNKAVEDWTASGTWDYDKYPNLNDFASEESQAKYAGAMEEFEIEFKEWEAKNTAFMEVFQKCLETAPEFTFNNVFLSADGKRYLTSTSSNNGGGGVVPLAEDAAEKVATPYLFNLEDNSYKTYESENGIVASDLTSDYTILGAHQTEDGLPQACVITPWDDKAMMINEYFNTFDPANATWVEDNMTHDVPALDFETGETVILPDVLCSGTPIATPDKAIFGFNVENVWDYSIPTYFFSYIVYPSYAGIEGVATDGFAVRSTGAGNLLVKGAEALVEVYSTDGAKVYETRGEGALSTGLPAGIYIVKATPAAGEAVTLKVAF